MKNILLRFFSIVIGLVATFNCSPMKTMAHSADWSSIENVFGKKGTIQGEVFKITFPRSDLNIHVGDVKIETGLALTSWLAFSSMGAHAMVMGDLVLLESEIPAVEKTLTEHSLKINAIHNHITGEEPKIMYMHIGGEGDPVQLAEGMKSVLAKTATPLSQQPQMSEQPVIDWSKVESALARAGKHNGNLLQFGIPRVEKIMENGMEIPPFMGMATVINIQHINEEKAATTGDFVLLAGEVDSVVTTLIMNGFTVTAIHSHILFESPRLIFVHFWKVDDPVKIAEGLKKALEKTNSIW